MEKILLLGAGTQALAIVRGLAKAGHDVYMLTGEHGNYVDVSRYISKCFYCHIPTMSDGFLQYVEGLIAKEGIDVLIPMGDESAEFLSRNKERLHKIVKFTSPDYEIFLKGYDKNKLMSLCQEKGYPHPQTVDLTKTSINDEKLLSFPYPAMLKPNCTTGGRGMVVVNSHDELLDRYPDLHNLYGDYHLQRFIREGGRQVKIQLCVDKDGKLIAHSAMHKVRWYPVRGGSSCCAVSIEEPKMTEVCSDILRDIQWEGFADFDLIEDPDTKQLLIMEINPRLPACIGAAIHAGMDWGQIIVDQALGKEPKHYEYRTGVALRHLGFDVLWFLKSPMRFKTKPLWFKFFGRNVYYQDMNGWADPKPFFAGTFHNIKKLFDPSFKKAKQIG